MRNIYTILLMSVMAFGISTSLKAAEDKPSDKLQTVVFKTNITCNNCKERIEGNLPFEKGVKNVEVNVEEKLVSVQFDPSKTDSQKLKESIEKLGYSAEAVPQGCCKDKSGEADTHKCGEQSASKCCAGDAKQ